MSPLSYALLLLISPILAQESPLADMASAFLQNLSEGGGQSEGGLAALGSIVGSLMQGDNAQNIGALFGGNQAGDVLSGLGSLLSNQEGQIDPGMVGSMISMFAQQASKSDKQRSTRQAEELDFSGLLGAAGSLFEGHNAAGFLPVIMNALGSFSGPQAEERAHNHDDHASFLPPLLEKAHVYWDHFTNSELGRAIWKQLGLQRVLKTFEGEDGKLDLELLLRKLENHSYRRVWIKHAAQYLTEYAVHLAKPEVQQRYLASSQLIINGFLTSQGFPQHTLFNPARAIDSLGALANHVAKKYLDVDSDVAVYLKPALEQIQRIVTTAQSTGKQLLSHQDTSAVTDLVTDTLNLEVIEPVLRVHRAYRHSLLAPHCREHLMCLVNKRDEGVKLGLPGFKSGLTKLSSLIASAALSYHSGEGFWELYNAVQADVNCEAKYPADCSAFHQHEVKVTTEYYHNEL